MAGRFNARLHPRNNRGQFARKAGTVSRSNGVSYTSKKGVTLLTVKTNAAGKVVVRPVPQRTLETYAFQGKKLVGQANTRVGRKGAVLEQVHVDRKYRGKGIAGTLVAHQNSVLRDKPLAISGFRSDDGEALARRLKGVKVSARTTKAGNREISRNIESSWSADQEYWAAVYKPKQRKRRR